MPQQNVSTNELPTIAAIATAPGRAAIAVIRISGRQSFSIVGQCLNPRDQQAMVQWPARYLKLVDLYDDQGVAIDQVLMAKFLAPASFTGEDMVEINCHGGSFIVQKILQRLFELGCQQAPPGEFTRRAYLHGKIDLTQAEGIYELIHAHTESQWRAAKQLADGALTQRLMRLRQQLIEASAYLAAAIDFPDEGDTSSIDLTSIGAVIEGVERDIMSLLGSAHGGRVAAQGLRVAIVGPPNAGKSTLLNWLLNEQRAIVSDIAGTTRDYIEESCVIKGRLFSFVDTAGLRQSSDQVEQLGVSQSRRIAQEADLCLCLLPVDISVREEQIILAELEESVVKDKVVVRSKMDLWEGSQVAGPLAISLVTMQGCEQLLDYLCEYYDQQIGCLDHGDGFLTNERQKNNLESALASLQEFKRQLTKQASEDLLVFELQQALRHLQSIIGSVGVDDVLDDVFRKFCVGK